MAQLFSKTTIQDQIQIYDGVDMSDAIQIVTDLYADQKNWLTKDETRYEQRFNGLFFGELLWYEENKNRHPKASTPVWGKIADLGLGIYSDGKYSYEWVRVIVELKWSTASLDKKQASYGGQTPVDQWFGYKTSFTQDPRLVVSNFGSIRLYRDNKQDYEVWTLEELASGDNDWYELKKLLLLMQKKNLIAASGESYTQKLLTKFRYDQEHISKKFYTEYKALRLELINDIRSRNDWVTIDLVVEKAQKLIDRVIFVHFCEDKGLLPADKLKEVIEFGEKAMSPTFQTLTNFFEAVNSGSPKLEIPNGYNGWLFHKDPELDALQVGDEICRKFVALWLYDFDGELSVNILGHIFEQSISDLEQLKIDLLGTETQTDDLVETKTSKRKKDGIFYTPEYIVDYIIQHSLMTRLEEQEAACMAKIGKKKWYKDELEATMAYQAILQWVKVLDPACGSGAFLVKVFDYLYAENKRVGAIVGSLFDDDALYKNILSQNIYGVDLNAESVEITKLSLWLKSAQKWKKLNNLDKNIKCGNSLIDDPEVAGDKAFDWHIEFKDIMNEWGFDVVVGNPPYVSFQNIQKKIKRHMSVIYQSATWKYDLYVLFVELAINTLKHWWKFSYIIPNKFILSEYWNWMKGVVLENSIVWLLDLQEINVFEDASTYPCILTVSKQSIKNNSFQYVYVTDQELNWKKQMIKQDWLWVSWRSLASELTWDILLKIEKWNTSLKELANEITQGLRTWKLDVFCTDLNVEFIEDRWFSKNLIHRVYTWSNVKRYQFNFDENYICYPYTADWSIIDIDNFPNWRKYFLENKELLMKRKDSWKIFSDTAKKYYEYRDKKQVVFNKPKIVFPDISKQNNFFLDLEWIPYINSCYWIFLKDVSLYKFVTLILNSKIFWFYIKNVSPSVRWWYFRYKTWYLQKFHIPIIDKIQIDGYDAIYEKISQCHTKYYTTLQQTLDLLQSEYWLDKIPKKLQKFTELDFETFVKTLKLKKLSLDQKEELMAYFNKKHKLLSDLQSQIDTLDSEIDEMVFDLYGLSEEERRIVLGG